MTYSDINKVFSPFKDRHVGQTAIVFATGPSLNNYDYLEDNGSVIKIGVNSIATKPIQLDYYFCGHTDTRSQNYLPILKDYYVKGAKFGFVRIDGIYGESDNEWLSLSEAKNLELIPYGLTTEIIFHRDISKYRIVNHLIIFSALQFAIFTGIKKIYLVGSDATDIISCDNLEKDPSRDISIILEVFSKFAQFAKQEGVEIISINPVGLKGMFTDIYR